MGRCFGFRLICLELMLGLVIVPYHAYGGGGDGDVICSPSCQNGGTCTKPGESGEVVNICSCVPGYAGDYCEKDIDDCIANPCLNGGACIDRVNGYKCRCAAGYEGSDCQTKSRGRKRSSSTFVASPTTHQHGAAGSGKHLYSRSVQSEIECAMACSTDPACQSFELEFEAAGTGPGGRVLMCRMFSTDNTSGTDKSFSRKIEL